MPYGYSRCQAQTRTQDIRLITPHPNSVGRTIYYIIGLQEESRIGQHGTVNGHLKFGASVEARNSVVDRQLHVPARNGYHETMRVLLRLVTDIKARNPHSECPLHVASRNGHQETVRIMLQCGATSGASNFCNNRPLHPLAGHGQSTAMSVLLEYEAAVHTHRTSQPVVDTWKSYRYSSVMILARR